jgi:hypothetical protein
MTETTTFELDEAIIQACGTAFYYKSQVRALFLKAGVPPPMYDRHGDLSKFQTARLVLGELDQLGESGRKVKRKLVTELAGLRTPMENADNPRASRHHRPVPCVERSAWRRGGATTASWYRSPP